MSIRIPRLLVALTALASVAAGQDVTTGELFYFKSDVTPDGAPASLRPLRVEFPTEMRATAQPGYVIVTRYVDADGESRSLEVLGGAAPYRRAVEAAVADWPFKPATRQGAPIAASVWFPVIFNPKPAGDDALNSIPRLLAATPVVVGNLEKEHAVSIPVAFSVDAEGTITNHRPETELRPKFRRALDEALKSWRFSPARRNGQSIAADITVPVVFIQQRPVRRNAEPPKVIHREEPHYPYAMRKFGLGGRVVIDYVVDTAGRVQNAYVISSNNPEFEQPALEAMRKWTFKPGTVNGTPVNTHMQQPIEFHLTDNSDTTPFQISGKVDQSKLPPELRYDTPPKLRNVGSPVYPYPLRREGITGKAKVSMLIGPNGHVLVVKVLQADRPEFGAALAAAVEKFEFDPALKNGVPVPHLLAFEQYFNDRELPDEQADHLLSLEKKHPDRIVSGSKLDAALKPLSRPPPQFPTTVPESVSHGSAMLEGLIDEDGRVRLPRVVEASDPAFGYAAAQAFAAWSFVPPKTGGRGAVVRVRVPFEFERK